MEDVNRLLRQYEQMQKMMKQFKKQPQGAWARHETAAGRHVPLSAAFISVILRGFAPVDIHVFKKLSGGDRIWLLKSDCAAWARRRLRSTALLLRIPAIPRDGRFIEEIGYYDPTKEPAVVKIDAEKAKKWIANGAQPTDTVRVLLKKNEIL